MRVLNLSFVCGASILVAACGGAPSDADLKAAVKKQMDADEKAAGMFADMMPKITVLNKIGCKEDGEKAYKCDLEVEVTQGKNVNKGPAQLRFVKTSDGWQVTK